MLKAKKLNFKFRCLKTSQKRCCQSLLLKLNNSSKTSTLPRLLILYLWLSKQIRSMKRWCRNSRRTSLQLKKLATEILAWRMTCLKNKNQECLTRLIHFWGKRKRIRITLLKMKSVLMMNFSRTKIHLQCKNLWSKLLK